MPTFDIPTIKYSRYSDTIKSRPFEAKYLMMVDPKFIGKYKFSDTIDLYSERMKTSYSDNYQMYDNLQQIIDIVGLEMIIDYNQTIKYDYYGFGADSTLYDFFPVYFVNSTKTDKLFLGKDGHTFGLQEAINEDGVPYPIESLQPSFCGNGRWQLIIHPGEFVLVLMHKYNGDFKTKLRSRFEIGENRFVSKYYEGYINKNQFIMHDSSFIKRLIKNRPERDVRDWFYGTLPYKINE